MIKTLRAYGPQGKYGENQWNWCHLDELVGVHGQICTLASARCECGCGISFTGLQSAKATTRAIVTHMDEEEFEGAVKAFYDDKLLDEGHCAKRRCKSKMDWLLGELWRFPIGEILHVEKVPFLRLIKGGDE